MYHSTLGLLEPASRIIQKIRRRNTDLQALAMSVAGVVVSPGTLLVTHLARDARETLRREKILIELMTSDRKLQTSREGWK